ncbi:hypothetical protein [Rhodococcus rhodochrous]|uniref:hypothetical protein n=1 Tax=Rhodococcus rhodochrous TaxID=1829 RepID=UPI00177C87C3|nr:hypothetical protein [Rhodococcus rhodochrous]
MLAHKVAGSDNESNSWQHATFFLIAVYRNARYGGMNMGNNSSSATMSWAPVRLDVTDGTSWGVRIGAHRTATDLLSSALTGYAVRSDLNHTAMLSDSAGGITNGGFTQNTSVNATGANRTYNIGLIYTPGEQVETSGQIKVFDGSEFAPKPVKVWNGTEWVTKPVKRWDGSNWVETNY